jgi:hypothetical protein
MTKQKKQAMPAHNHPLESTRDKTTFFDCSRKQKGGIARKFQNLLSGLPNGSKVVLDNVSTEAQNLITPVLRNIIRGLLHTSKINLDVIEATNFNEVKQLVFEASNKMHNDIEKEDGEVKDEDLSDEENAYESENEGVVSGDQVNFNEISLSL